MTIKRIILKEYKLYFPRVEIQTVHDLRFCKQNENLVEHTCNIHIFIQDYKPYFNKDVYEL